MSYLLDTDVIVNHLRKKVPLHEKYLSQGCMISVITQAELVFGACNSVDPGKTTQVTERFFDLFAVTILPLSDRVLHLYGKIKTDLQRSGQLIDDFDLLIGSTALAHSLILHTANRKHFQRIPGLQIE